MAQRGTASKVPAARRLLWTIPLLLAALVTGVRAQQQQTNNNNAGARCAASPEVERALEALTSDEDDGRPLTMAARQADRRRPP